MLSEKISNEIPFEILCLIFENLRLQELLCVSKVSVAWNQAALSNQLWSNSALEITPAMNSMKINYNLLSHHRSSFKQIKTFRIQSRMYLPQLRLVLEFIPHLTRIQLTQCGLSSETLILIFRTYSKTLKNIDVSTNREVNDNVLNAMTNCSFLQAVCLSSCMNFSAQALSNLIKNRKLSHIVLQKLYSLTENDLAMILDALFQNSDGIRFLDVSYNHHLITLNALEKLCSLFTIHHRVLLNCSNCEQLVRKDVEKLQKRYPFASIMHNTVLYDYSVESIKHYLDFVLSS